MYTTKCEPSKSVWLWLWRKKISQCEASIDWPMVKFVHKIYILFSFYIKMKFSFLFVFHFREALLRYQNISNLFCFQNEILGWCLKGAIKFLDHFDLLVIFFTYKASFLFFLVPKNQCVFVLCRRHLYINLLYSWPCVSFFTHSDHSVLTKLYNIE